MSSSPTAEPTWRRKSVKEMNSEERLASLKEWAEEKKYVQPGEGGTLNINGRGGINSLVFGGPLATSSRNNGGDRYAGQYEAPVGPPSYRVATNEEGPKKRTSKLGKWLDKRKEKKAAGCGERAPVYTP